MKDNATNKQIFEMILGTFLVSGSFFALIPIGNIFGIFIMPNVFGLFIVICGIISPLIYAYMLLSLWGDICGVGGFLRWMLRCKSQLIAILLLASLLIYYTVSAVASCKMSEMSDGALAVYCIISALYALSSECWLRGCVFPSIKAYMPSLFAAFVCGILEAVYLLPLWYIMWQSGYHEEYWYLVVFVLLLSVVLSAMMVITKCLMTCVIFKAIACGLSFCFEGVRLKNPAVSIFQMILFFAGCIALIVTKGSIDRQEE